MQALRRVSVLSTRRLAAKQSPQQSALLVRGLHATTSVRQNDSEIDKLLRDDIKTLGRVIGDCIRDEDVCAFESVEQLRRLGRHWRTADDQSFEHMVSSVKSYDPQRLLRLAKSFAHFLALSNCAENHHRIRRLRNALQEAQSPYGLWPKHDSCGGALSELVLKQGVPAERVFEALTTQSVDVVLTAHPTEVNRRTMLQKHLEIHRVLAELDRQDLSLYERRELQEEMRAQVTSIWTSDSLRRTRQTPVDEAKFGLAVVETSLWDAVPKFLRKLDDVMRNELGAARALPLDAVPVRFSSWMGGDRDGNPNVTPEITLEVSLLNRWMAATLYQRELHELRASLSVLPCNEEIRQAVPNAREPYREYLRALDAKLQATLDWTNRAFKYLEREKQKSTLQTECALIHEETRSVLTPPKHALLSVEELLQPLQAVHRSLCETSQHALANGPLTDLIRRAHTFGATLLRMDIRQESARHTEALNAITQHLGIGSFAEWSEHKRRVWLTQELSSKRPLLAHCEDYSCSLGFSKTVNDTLRTFDVAAALHGESLNAYVISHCTQVSDVLAVALLQQNAAPLSTARSHIVPLFETLEDLENAPRILDELLSVAPYVACIEGKQEVMIGYSDSAKDAGRLTAAWAQYIAQTEMSQIAHTHRIELTFFHGKGGSVGRGGNPAQYEAILAHPPSTVQGRFRATEQGEMITQHLTHRAVAERSMDILTAAVLAEQFVPRVEVKPEWVAVMGDLSEKACAAYRAVVREDERFVSYFHTATPERELSKLNVGSRPQARALVKTAKMTQAEKEKNKTKKPEDILSSLRAIPWNFAWTQTRLQLPSWLGVGEALAHTRATHPSPAILHEMYSQWPWFHTFMDLMEMVCAKCDERIAENYDTQLLHEEVFCDCERQSQDGSTASAASVSVKRVCDCVDVRERDAHYASLRALGRELRTALSRTVEEVLAVSQNTQLQQHNAVLLRSLTVRNPYIDALNVVQAELLRRLRNDDHVRERVELQKESEQSIVAAPAAAIGTKKPLAAHIASTQAAHAPLSEEERQTLQDALLVTINGIANGMRNSG